MKDWFSNLWNSKARKYVIIGILSATGVGAGVAVPVGTAIDQGIEQIESAE
ncbi:hypothetical protein [Marinobacter adhaerens]|uniref:hypothetical protein n=1 Tax=Marinobacter adhaerens TaxID=1033846 RepID=UPI003D267876